MNPKDVETRERLLSELPYSVEEITAVGYDSMGMPLELYVTEPIDESRLFAVKYFARMDDRWLEKIFSAFAGGTFIPQTKTRERQPMGGVVYDIVVGNSPVRGAEDAKVMIVEFVDFQCPYCARELPKLKQILDEYPSDVRVVFKHFPLSFHKQAKPAHAVTKLAYREKGNEGFWQIHDAILSNQKELGTARLRDYAQNIGLDSTQFDEVVGNTAKMEDLIGGYKEEAMNCNVRGTPTEFINGVNLTDRSLEGYRARIRNILDENR